jgi:hypothetical protein
MQVGTNTTTSIYHHSVLREESEVMIATLLLAIGVPAGSVEALIFFCSEHYLMDQSSDIRVWY